MSELQDRINLLEDEKSKLDKLIRDAISTAPRTFEHLDSTDYWKDRWFIVRADGTMHGIPYIQRPAAERRFHQVNKSFNNNLFLYDKREKIIYDHDLNRVSHDRSD